MKISRTINYDYEAVPTVKAFLKCDSFINGIMGPIGSGKSSGCVMFLLNKAFEQEPDADGVRRTRFALIRNTYRQIKDTTKKTVVEWVPFATWKESEDKFTIDIARPDGTVVQSEWLMRALDSPEQLSSLLSLEITGAWINEAREVPKEVFEMIQTRVRRYPRRDADFGPTWAGVIMDTNPPDTDHWWYKLFEEIKPSNATLFRQPSGISSEAENLMHLDVNYYKDVMEGKDEDFIRVYVHAEYGYLKEGKAVWQNFRETFHVVKEELKPITGLPLVIGLDCGLMPAAVFTQYDPKGRVFVLDELQGEFMSMREFAVSMLRPLMQSKYRFFEHLIVGDPAGAARSQLDSRTVYHELRSLSLKAKPAKTNAINARIGAVNQFLTRLINGKDPAFILSPRCTLLKRAMTGHYRYRRMRLTGERYTDVPDKNEYSHIADALQYACLEHETGFVGINSRPLDERYRERERVPSSLAWT